MNTVYHTYKICECEIAICYDTLNLVEFRKMCSIGGLISEYSINTEELCGFESSWLSGDLT